MELCLDQWGGNGKPHRHDCAVRQDGCAFRSGEPSWLTPPWRVTATQRRLSILLVWPARTFTNPCVSLRKDMTSRPALPNACLERSMEVTTKPLMRPRVYTRSLALTARRPAKYYRLQAGESTTPRDSPRLEQALRQAWHPHRRSIPASPSPPMAALPVFKRVSRNSQRHQTKVHSSVERLLFPPVPRPI